MLFRKTNIEGVLVIEPEPIYDERGFFSRIWCTKEFQNNGIDFRILQSSVSFNKEAGVLRGMHVQNAPYGEHKIVRCTRGAIYDVALDIRHDSPTFKRWYAIELNESNRMSLYIAPGLAHGFQTLVENCEVTDQMSEFYYAPSATGVRWNDPAFAIEWPAQPSRIISSKDASLPDFDVRKQLSI